MAEKGITVRNSVVYGFVDKLIDRVKNGEFDNQLSNVLPRLGSPKSFNRIYWQINLILSPTATMSFEHNYSLRENKLSIPISIAILLIYYLALLVILGCENIGFGLFLVGTIFGSLIQVLLSNALDYYFHYLKLKIETNGETFIIEAKLKKEKNRDCETIEGYSDLRLLNEAIMERLRLIRNGSGNLKEINKLFEGA